jgi:hypothetical protein
MIQSSEEVMSGIFAECIDMLMSGTPEATCYERFPELAPELEALIGTTARLQKLRAVPPRDPAVAEARRRDFLASAYQLHLSHNRRTRPTNDVVVASWLQTMATRLLGPGIGFRRQKSVLFSIISYLLLIAFTGILVTGAVTASAAALPGDLLYPVKTATENVQVFFTREATARAELEQTLQERRFSEIQAVLDRRRIATLPLQGLIEQLNSNIWVVSGLRITLTADTLIEGHPEVGARIEGRVQAPGDGSLLALRIEVVEQAASTVVVAAPPTPVPTAKPAPASPTAAPPTPQAPVAPGRVIHLPTVPISEPVDPTVTPTPRPTATPTATRTYTPTRRPTITPTPLPTATPASRERKTGMVSGIVMAIDGNRWLIAEVWVETFEGTRYGGNPRVGVHVDVIIEFRPGQLPLALEIIERNLPPITPFTVTGRVVQTGETWVLAFEDGQSWSFRVTPQTQFVNGQAGVGDVVTVEGQDGPGGRVALKITRITREDTFVEGEIDEIATDHWIIGGRWVIISAETKISGEKAEPGRWARANGYETGDGSAMIATEIYVE